MLQTFAGDFGIAPDMRLKQPETCGDRTEIQRSRHLVLLSALSGSCYYGNDCPASVGGGGVNAAPITTATTSTTAPATLSLSMAMVPGNSIERSKNLLYNNKDDPVLTWVQIFLI